MDRCALLHSNERARYDPPTQQNLQLEGCSTKCSTKMFNAPIGPTAFKKVNGPLALQWTLASYKCSITHAGVEFETTLAVRNRKVPHPIGSDEAILQKSSCSPW